MPSRVWGKWDFDSCSAHVRDSVVGKTLQVSTGILASALTAGTNEMDFILGLVWRGCL